MSRSENYAIMAAILRSMVERGTPYSYLGSYLALNTWMSRMESEGWILGEMVTDKGRRIYLNANLRAVPVGRWYFFAEMYQHGIEYALNLEGD
jgi:hypothetical protein